MKPKYPLTQAFDKLPSAIPILVLENALLPGGELPLEFSTAVELAMLLRALRTDQLIGMIQPRRTPGALGVYRTGCAGRIRQYRERKDGRINIMLTGVCRYEVVDETCQQEGYTVATVDWSGYENDYETEMVGAEAIKAFMGDLHQYFDRHGMRADWKVLDELPIEQVVNNLILVVNLDIDSKQRLLESPTVAQRMLLFSQLLNEKESPILVPSAESNLVN